LHSPWKISSGIREQNDYSKGRWAKQLLGSASIVQAYCGFLEGTKRNSYPEVSFYQYKCQVKVLSGTAMIFSCQVL
jgi:hypothetical protein